MSNSGPWWAHNDPTYVPYEGPLDQSGPTAGPYIVRVLPNAERRHPRRTHGQRGAALAFSGLSHAMLVLGLLLHPMESSFGAAGPDFGTGIPVALVAGFASGGPQVGPVESQATEADAERDELQLEDTEPLTAGPDQPDVTTPPEEQEATRPPMRAAMARAELGQAAGAFEGAVGASASQGGDPTATSDLLGQIARCLPPGFRPRLGFSQLTLAIGPDGRLRTAPTVTSAVPQISAADRAAADRIVQAALLCGPYSHPDAVNEVISLPADFSAIKDISAPVGTLVTSPG